MVGTGKSNPTSAPKLPQGSIGAQGMLAVQGKRGQLDIPDVDSQNVQRSNLSNMNRVGIRNNNFAGGMMNAANLPQAIETGSFNIQQSMHRGMGPHLQNLNSVNMNSFMKLQQLQQQRQRQQQMLMIQHHQQMFVQQQRQKMQANLNMRAMNSQNINLSLMTSQQQMQERIFGYGAGMSLPGNIHPNKFIAHMMQNQMQHEMHGLGAVRNTPVTNGGNIGNVDKGLQTIEGGLHGEKNQILGREYFLLKDGSRRLRGGVIEPFPEKLHRLLLEVESAGRSDVISFVANGRAFAIHKANVFFKEIVPHYFRQSHLSSFKRQLNLYGFELINAGAARGGYFHEMFVKDKPELCRRMRRVPVKIGARKVGKKGKGEDAPSETDGKPTIGFEKETISDVSLEAKCQGSEDKESTIKIEEE